MNRRKFMKAVGIAVCAVAIPVSAVEVAENVHIVPATFTKSEIRENNLRMQFSIDACEIDRLFPYVGTLNDRSITILDMTYPRGSLLITGYGGSYDKNLYIVHMCLTPKENWNHPFNFYNYTDFSEIPKIKEKR